MMEQQKSRSNTLLVELMIVILFFALSVTVLIKMFFGANRLSSMAGAETEALSAAQNIADGLRAADNREGYLQSNGFTLEGDRYAATEGAYTLYATLSDPQETEGGFLTEDSVTAEYKGKTLFTLDCTRYREVTP